MKKHFLFLVFLTLIAKGIFAQQGSSCDSAIAINANSCLNNQFFSSNVWYKTTANQNHLIFKVFNTTDTTAGQINSIRIYSGSCSSLTLFGSKTVGAGDSIVYDTTGYITGQTYYVEGIYQPAKGCVSCIPKSADFNFCVQDLLSCLITCNCTGLYCVNSSATFNACQGTCAPYTGGYNWTFTVNHNIASSLV